jgi:hypothetical protein
LTWQASGFIKQHWASLRRRTNSHTRDSAGTVHHGNQHHSRRHVPRFLWVSAHGRPASSAASAGRGAIASINKRQENLLHRTHMSRNDLSLSRNVYHIVHRVGSSVGFFCGIFFSISGTASGGGRTANLGFPFSVFFLFALPRTLYFPLSPSARRTMTLDAALTLIPRGYPDGRTDGCFFFSRMDQCGQSGTDGGWMEPSEREPDGRRRGVVWRRSRRSVGWDAAASVALLLCLRSQIITWAVGGMAAFAWISFAILREGSSCPPLVWYNSSSACFLDSLIINTEHPGIS